MSSPSPLLQVSNISKSFPLSNEDSLPVVSDISFHVMPGTVTAILGASGCGKSTILSMISGLLSPDFGTISSNFTRPGKDLGMIQQSQRLLPWRTVLENVALGLELTGASKPSARRRSSEYLSAVGMSEFADYFPSQLSGGMTQRVLIARALITKPALLLLDEPLGQLDIIARKDLASMILDYVATHAAATIIVTHSVEEAIFMADHVIILQSRPSRIYERFSISRPLVETSNSYMDRDQLIFEGDLKVLEKAAAFEVIQESLIRASTIR